MRWIKQHMETYIPEKEYIDTVVIPVQPFQLSSNNDLLSDTFNSEVLAIYAHEIEKELSGRLLLTPTYTYVKSANMEKEIERLNEWIHDIQSQPFQHIFILTLDVQLKKHERLLDAHLLWLPSLSATNLQSKEAVDMIRSQIGQIRELIRTYW